MKNEKWNFWCIYTMHKPYILPEKYSLWILNSYLIFIKKQTKEDCVLKMFEARWLDIYRIACAEKMFCVVYFQFCHARLLRTNQIFGQKRRETELNVYCHRRQCWCWWYNRKVEQIVYQQYLFVLYACLHPVRPMAIVLMFCILWAHL